MKKFTLLLALALVGSAAYATTNRDRVDGFAKKMARTPELSTETNLTHNAPEFFLKGEPIEESRANYPTIIKNVEGEAHPYIISATGYSNDMGLGSGRILYGKRETASEVVYGEGNVVYIKNIITAYNFNSYVEGTIDGDVITVKFPQCIYGEYDPKTGGGAYYYAVVCELDERQQTYTVGGKPEVTYTVSGDKLTLNLNNGSGNDISDTPQYIIGVASSTMSGDKSWVGMGDAYQTFTPFVAEANETPEGLEPELWYYMSTGGYTGTVNVATDKENVYISGLYDADPTAPVIGTVTENGLEMTFPQYLGHDKKNDMYVYAVGLTGLDNAAAQYELVNTLTLDYDAEAKTIKMNDENAALVINYGSIFYNPDETFQNVYMQYQTEEQMGANPANPKFVHGYNLGKIGYVEWDIPAVNVNGYILDTNRMYYEVYLDDARYSFMPSTYMNISAITRQIPYNFDDSYDFFVDGSLHEFTIFQTYEKFGLQSFYQASNGKLYMSKKVSSDDPEEDGINDIVNEGNVVATEYYNVQGMRVDNPTNGLYIVRKVMSDGTVNSTKVVK